MAFGKFLKKLVGGVAMIAAPFIAAPIAGAIGVSGALGSAVVGAGIGAAGSALVGGDPWVGAAIGGLGGFAGGGGLTSFGLGGQSGAMTAAAQGTGPGAIASSAVSPVARAGLAAAAPTAATSAAPAATGLSGIFGGGGGMLGGIANSVLSNPAGLARLAMTVFGRPPQMLTEAELDQLADLERIAAQDRELFDQRREVSDQFFRTADQQAPNLEQAYGTAKIGLERRLSDANRGATDEAAAYNTRRTALASARAGATAAAAERERAFNTQTQLRQAGLSTLPQNSPAGYGSLAIPTYNDLEQRRNTYNTDLAQTAGTLFGERDYLSDGLTSEADQRRAGLTIG